MGGRGREPRSRRGKRGLPAELRRWPSLLRGGLVVRGSVRLVAATATRRRGAVRGEDLAPSDRGRWRELRSGLERRQEARAQGHRFRHDPQEYLRRLEETLIKGILPS